MANRSPEALASIERKRLVDERMILLRQMSEPPGASSIFGKDRAILPVGAGTTGVQHKRDGVVQWFTLHHLNIFADCISKIAFWHRREDFRNGFPIQTDPISMKDREVDSEIGIALGAAIPVFPGASAQLLLIALPMGFTKVQITGQRVLVGEQILLNQETDVERTRHHRDPQEEFNASTFGLQVYPLCSHHDHIDIAPA